MMIIDNPHNYFVLAGVVFVIVLKQSVNLIILFYQDEPLSCGIFDSAIRITKIE